MTRVHDDRAGRDQRADGSAPRRSLLPVRHHVLSQLTQLLGAQRRQDRTRRFGQVERGHQRRRHSSMGRKRPRLRHAAQQHVAVIGALELIVLHERNEQAF